MFKRLIALSVGGALLAAMTAAMGGSSEDAAKLKGPLTPVGAERAGNKDGSIPSWEGGIRQPSAGYKSGQPRPDLYPAEKPLFSINGKNLDQYGEQLADGVKAMLQKYPNYRLDVYPSHRTAAYPQYVVDNTAANATRAKLRSGGYGIEGAYGGVPFPVPKDAFEVMWNHQLRWQGEATATDFQAFVTTADGKRVMAAQVRLDTQYPYYYKDGSPEKFSGEYYFNLTRTTAPSFKAGEIVLFRDPVDFTERGRQAWQYLAGQRRVRRAPTIAYDTPNFVTSGVNFFDEIFLFFGPMDRYDWKLVGKKEMFIPYNNNRFTTAKVDDALGPNYVNPDLVRWERHRVWVVDANLLAGKRHVVPKRRFYIDEDTWTVILSDGWDSQGKLWRTGFTLPMVFADFPAVCAFTYGQYDLISGAWIIDVMPNELPTQFQMVDKRPDTYFTPDAIAGSGVR